MKRILASFLCLLLLFSAFTPFVGYAESENEEVIRISSQEEFLAFAKNCSFDKYSKNMVVELMTDIDLSVITFEPIAIFCGTFNGNHHTISGLTINYSGSNVGLFRYLTDQATVRNLNVKGVINAEGSMKHVGGVVGSNAGRLLNVDFEGVVNGKNIVGGIVGVNTKTGYIGNCESKGAVNAEMSTGGIAGQNFGVVIKCNNESLVNTSMTEEFVKIEDIEVDLLHTQNEVVTHNDTGGIVGYSEGIIQSCINRGNVGYQHVGYNVGGIVGRHNGYLSNCNNYGYIQGRKDVGGIAGQLEPYLLVKFSEDTLQRLSDEFDNLEQTINSTLDHTDTSTTTFNNNMDELLNTTDLARDELKIVADGTTEFVDESVAEINEISLRVSLFTDALEVTLDKTNEALTDVEVALENLSKGLSDLKTSASYASDGFDDMSEAFEDLSRAMMHMHSGIEKIQEANKLLSDNLGDPDKMNEARQLLKDGFAQLRTANEILVPIFVELSKPVSDPIVITTELNKLVDILNGTDPLDDEDGALEKIEKGMTILLDVAMDDIETIRQALVILNQGFAQINQAVFFIEGANVHFSDAMKDFGHGADSLASGMDDFNNASRSFEKATRSLNDGVQVMKETLEIINDKEDIVFPTLGSKVSNAQDGLFKHLEAMNGILSRLNDDTKSSSDMMTTDLREINRQIFEIIDIIVEAKEVQNMDESERFTDISANDLNDDERREKLENIPLKGVHQGYLTYSYNYGVVEGDLDTGGIAGAIAIEYDFDPEDDLNTKGKESLNFQYQTKAVLKNAKNKGTVTSKKDYAGGVAGRMDLGVIYQSENYGEVTSTNGNYVGGIAGASTSIIRESYAKCYLEGGSHVGGIAGMGKDLISNYSQVEIHRSKECIGAIAGDANGLAEDNYFLNRNLNGIDNISYEGKAEPLSYDEMALNKALPDEFRRFNITFKVDGVVERIESFNYGDDASSISLPPIKEREGYYGQWPELTGEMTFSKTLEAEYVPKIKSIADDKNSKLSKVIVEGEFSPLSSVNFKSDEVGKYQSKFDEDVAEYWTIAIDDHEENDRYAIRYRLPETSSDVRFYTLEDEMWTEVDYEKDGSYAIISTPKNESTYVTVNVSKLWIYISVAIGIIGLIALLVHFIRKFKRR